MIEEELKKCKENKKKIVQKKTCRPTHFSQLRSTNSIATGFRYCSVSSFLCDIIKELKKILGITTYLQPVDVLKFDFLQTCLALNMVWCAPHSPWSLYAHYKAIASNCTIITLDGEGTMLTLFSDAHNYTTSITGMCLRTEENFSVFVIHFWFLFKCYSRLHWGRYWLVALDNMAALASHCYIPVAPHHCSVVLHNWCYTLCL